MTRPLTLTLTAAARHDLEQVVRRDPRAYLRERAAFLLKLAAGATIPALTRAGLLRGHRRETLYQWRLAYLAGGIDGLVMQPRRHAGLPP